MSRPRAFLVEADADLAIIFAQALRDGGFEVTALASRIDALAALQTQVVALVVIDLHLPGMSGEAFMNQVGRNERLVDLVVVALTDNHIVAESLARLLPRERVLVKPITYTRLRDLAGQLRREIQS